MANDLNLPLNRKEVVDRAKTNVQNALQGSQTFLPNSFIGALITGYGGSIYDVYVQLGVLILQLFPNTATMDQFIGVWANYVSIIRLAATQGKGTNCLTITGVEGTNIPAGTNYTVSGLIYTTTDDVSIETISISVTLTRVGNLVTATSASNNNLANGQSITISGALPTDYNGTFVVSVLSITQFTYTIETEPSTPATGSPLASFIGALASLECQSFGANTNQENGVQMTISTPLDDVDNIARVNVNTVANGADLESPESWNNRIKYRYQNIHALFNPPQITTYCLGVQGVTRVWVFRATPSTGYVSVYVVDDNSNPIIPSPSLIAAVRNKLLEILPADMEEYQLITAAPTAVPVNFTFTAISPDTQQMRDAINNSLYSLFRSRNEVSESMQEQVYLGAIGNTIDDGGVQLQTFTLSSPTGDINITAGQLATLGTSNL